MFSKKSKYRQLGEKKRDKIVLKFLKSAASLLSSVFSSFFFISFCFLCLFYVFVCVFVSDTELSRTHKYLTAASFSLSRIVSAHKYKSLVCVREWGPDYTDNTRLVLCPPYISNLSATEKRVETINEWPSYWCFWGFCSFFTKTHI